MSEEAEVYANQFERIASCCRDYLHADAADDDVARLLFCGALIGELAALYNMGTFGGVMDPRTLFVARGTLPKEVGDGPPVPPRA